MNAFSTVGGRLKHTLSTQHPRLHAFIIAIPYMPLSWRKLWVDVCQTSFNYWDHPRLLSTFERLSISQPIQLPLSEQPWSEKVATDYSKLLTSSPLISSIAISFLRSENSAIDDGSTQQLIETVSKEIRASITQRHMVIDPCAIFDETIKWGPHAPITPTFLGVARRFALKLGSICDELRGRGPIFPAVQRKKNMSQESSERLWSTGYRRSDGDYGAWDMRTVDLEKYYHETGEVVEGCEEMRWAWKFNDLKPRPYFATGSSSYWTSKYQKPVAVLIMNYIILSHVRTRKNPGSVADYVDEDDYVVIWDYSSFTTSLVELRHFLWWVARYLEDLIADQTIKVFDYRLGIISVKLWEIIDTYNEQVNCNARYSIHRVADDILFNDADGVKDVEMANSGCLGVHGNIGFSTALGAMHTSAKVKSAFAGVAMGDDILGVTKEDPTIDGGLVDHIRDLGEVPAEKFGIFGPTEANFQESDGWKFVKRPLRRYRDGLHIGELIAFPILAYVYNVKGPNRKFFDKDDYHSTVHRFCAQVCALLWDLQSLTSVVTHQDLDTIHSLLRPAYKFLGLPIGGALPGYVAKNARGESTHLKLCCPCIDFSRYDPTMMDWADFLWFQSPMLRCTLPMVSEAPINIDSYFEGWRIATGSKLNRVWVDLGYLEEGSKLTEMVVVTADNYWRFRAMLHGDGYGLVKYKWLKTPPSIFYTTLSDLAVPHVHTVHRVARLASLF